MNTVRNLKIFRSYKLFLEVAEMSGTSLESTLLGYQVTPPSTCDLFSLFQPGADDMPGQFIAYGKIKLCHRPDLQTFLQPM